jgi:TatD DNase family protein
MWNEEATLPRLFDVHFHAERYPPAEWNRILLRAQEAGLRQMIASGMDLGTSRQAVERAHSSPLVWASVGIHPWIAAKGLPSSFIEGLEELARDRKVVAIGEIGLDFVDDCAGTSFAVPPLRQMQEEAFRRQVQWAISKHLPMIVHTRGAYSRVISILKEENGAQAGGVVHNFDGSPDEADALWALGFYVSFGGALTYPQATSLQETACVVPLDRILFETDAPYMPLDQQETVDNEPANVRRIAQVLAQRRGETFERVAEATYQNFRWLFPRIRGDE